ncbi:MAG: carbamoyltransferase HypF [Lachnospiraceae bacterium]|nr:carbamoyltransferase HypF [Lachnospiraceae bacterium]
MLYQSTIHVFGIVQGVGFRPFTARLAGKFSLAGRVINRGAYVEIVAEGEKETLEAFTRAVKIDAPERAVVLRVDSDMRPAGKSRFRTFTIEESKKEKGAAFISPDIAICGTCSKELFDPGNRRYLHPFINCTQCGPRLTIMEGLPYDRERTSMKSFPMCPECRKEYTDPASRRYDAQPVCCPKCGPQVFLLGRESVRGGEAITLVRRTIMEGGIAAVKGIGGFHLVCDAKNEEAVSKLRRRKNRLRKPFAIMAADEVTAARECIFIEEQKKILTGHQKPILLLEKKQERDLAPGAAVPETAPSVAPDNPFLGVMLPYAPVQLLLFKYPDDVKMTDILVMTSANDSGAPICRTDEDARRELSDIADVILTNDRPILIRSDDSVMDFYRGEPYMVRRSRGFAPLPFIVDPPEEYGAGSFKGTVFAAGGELKNAFTIGINGLFYPSSYVGDLTDERTLQALTDSSERMLQLLEAKPEIAACDLHPDYTSARFAEALASRLGVPLVKVQHHYAHVLSCMAENNFSGPVLGVAFDGTGYGTDGSVWGGEILKCSYSGFSRLASIAPFLQPGGDLAAKEGWRCAVSMLLGTDDSGGAEAAERAAGQLGLANGFAVQVIGGMLKTGVNTVRSTSAGRLFDAVSAILGLVRLSSFEGEAAQMLEFAAMRHAKNTSESGKIREAAILLRQITERQEADSRAEAESSGGRHLIRTDLLFQEIASQRLKEVRAGKADTEHTERLAWLFHEGLAVLTAREVLRLAEQTGVRAAALSGGTFQNTLFLGMLEDKLKAGGMHVLRHHLLPCNDGGISLGQAAAACERLK